MTDAGGTLHDVGEFGLIDRITAGMATNADVVIGPGDDAAVVVAADGRVVISVDLLVEGRHFRRDWSTAIDIGRKAVAASLSDIYAMGAQPTSLVVGFGAPGDLPASWAVSCTSAMREEAAQGNAHLVGGDVVEAPQVVLSVTALGDLQGRSPVLRSGAQAGDVLALAGRIGWSAAGLMLLQRGFRSPKVLVDAHRFPTPPYGAGITAAVAGATSMIDISDGLVADLRHVAQASGVQVEIDSESLEVPEAMASAAAAYNVDAREWMLTGGEDHAIAATFPAGTKLPDGFIPIGTVTAGDPAVLVDGAVRERGGHEHFARS